MSLTGTTSATQYTVRLVAPDTITTCGGSKTMTIVVKNVGTANPSANDSLSLDLKTGSIYQSGSFVSIRNAPTSSLPIANGNVLKWAIPASVVAGDSMKFTISLAGNTTGCGSHTVEAFTTQSFNLFCGATVCNTPVMTSSPVTSTPIYTRCCGSIGNNVWQDSNLNGINDEAATAGINGVTVQLWNASTNTLFATTITTNDNNGNPGYYLFAIYNSGDFYIKFPPFFNGRPLTTQTSTPATTYNSDADTTTGQSPTFSINIMGIGMAKDNLTIGAGYICPSGCIPITVLKTK